jgi:hypothetical protein
MRSADANQDSWQPRSGFLNVRGRPGTLPIPHLRASADQLVQAGLVRPSLQIRTAQPRQPNPPRTPSGLLPVVKSRSYFASCRYSSVKCVENPPFGTCLPPRPAHLGPLETAQFGSIRQTVPCSICSSRKCAARDGQHWPLKRQWTSHRILISFVTVLFTSFPFCHGLPSGEPGRSG